MGEMCCTPVQPRRHAEQGNLRRAGLRRQQHGQHADAGPPVEPPSGRRQHADRRRQRQVHQGQRLAADLAGPGHAERRRGRSPRTPTDEEIRHACRLKMRCSTRDSSAAPALLLLAGWGCGNGVAALALRARWRATALEAALKAWRDGGKPGTAGGDRAPGRGPRHALEPGRAPRILRDPRRGGAAPREKRFAVRLTLAKPESAAGSEVSRARPGPGDGLSRRGLPAEHQHGDGPKLPKGDAGPQVAGDQVSPAVRPGTGESPERRRLGVPELGP